MQSDAYRATYNRHSTNDKHGHSTAAEYFLLPFFFSLFRDLLQSPLFVRLSCLLLFLCLQLSLLVRFFPLAQSTDYIDIDTDSTEDDRDVKEGAYLLFRFFTERLQFLGSEFDALSESVAREVIVPRGEVCNHT